MNSLVIFSFRDRDSIWSFGSEIARSLVSRGAPLAHEVRAILVIMRGGCALAIANRMFGGSPNTLSIRVSQWLSECRTGTANTCLPPKQLPAVYAHPKEVTSAYAVKVSPRETWPPKESLLACGILSWILLSGSEPMALRAMVLHTTSAKQSHSVRFLHCCSHRGCTSATLDAHP